MPRNISFSKTIEQFRNRTKTVTRRLRWRNLQAGTVLSACEKCMGLRPGQKIVRLGQIRVVDVRTEPLQRMLDDAEYGASESAKEGFPEMSGEEFVAMFCAFQGVTAADAVTRIEFEYL